jgi:transcriptional regulator with XRE-family HTH domain
MKRILAVDNLRFKGARSAARIDNAVGDRIRKRRMLLGYTQEQLADALEISYQQIQKYETGSNRVSAGRLFQIAQRLEAPVSYFFEGLGLEFDAEISGHGTAAVGSSRTVIDVVRNMGQIQDANVRSAIASLVKALAGADLQGIDNGHGNGHSDSSDEEDLADLMEDNTGHGGNAGSNGKSNGGRGAED